MKVAARLQVGMFDVVERGRILAGAGDPAGLRRPRLADASEQAAVLAAAGFDGVYTIEAAHDVFFPLVLAAQGAPAARRLELSTSLAIAFPRSPMHVAHQAWDLQLLSEGRFRLGLGTQVRQVNERYYGTPWSQPVERMRDYVGALQAVFRCWQEGEPLRHEGDFYRLSFMNPPFNPGPSPSGPPPVLLGALGPRMTRMAAEVADGLLLHPFVTERFVREQMLPEVRAGLDAAGRPESGFEIVPMVMIATGRDEREMAAADAGVAGLVAFYGSTPTYRPLLESEGLGDLHRELFALSRKARWADMSALVDEDVLTRFAVRGEPKTIGPQIAARYGDLAGRINSYLPYETAPDLLADVAGSISGASRREHGRGTASLPDCDPPTTTRRPDVALTIGSEAPDFKAETTEGPIQFHDWMDGKWTILFSHPRNFTPVCTTELGYMAKLKPEFDRRDVKIIGLSVDPLENHTRWAADIAETQGTAPNYPLIADSDFNVSTLYGMLPAGTSGDPTARTPADNATVRNVFVIGPDKKIKLILVYPMTTGRNFDEVLRVVDSLQLTAKHAVSTPVNWHPGEDVIIAGSVSDEQAKEKYPDGWKAPRPYIRIVPAPQ